MTKRPIPWTYWVLLLKIRPRRKIRRGKIREKLDECLYTI